MNQHKNIVIASGNPGKIKEIQAILKDYPIIPQSEFGVSEAEETGTTFVENAIIKARHAAEHANMAAIADDSGLVVDALQGEPGVISARYAGTRATDEENLRKVLRNLEGVPEDQRTARFICVIVLMRRQHDPMPIIAQGVWEGRILEQSFGENGFGYDPIFWVPEYQCASAELEPQVKNTLSHRGKALKMLTELFNHRAAQ